MEYTSICWISYFYDLHRIVKKTPKTALFQGVGRKTTSYKARCGHIDVTVDMLYPLKWGEKKYLYTFKYIKNDVPASVIADCAQRYEENSSIPTIAIGFSPFIYAYKNERYDEYSQDGIKNT